MDYFWDRRPTRVDLELTRSVPRFSIRSGSLVTQILCRLGVLVPLLRLFALTPASSSIACNALSFAGSFFFIVETMNTGGLKLFGYNRFGN
ncbi:hypothetical protein CCACVL1_07515 [Corchorus capsularis]|uniref:Uncharacterized protein n=1 Tax=Corchorus capsularis TaxID=210143 RepID=A0A1R3J5I7_COCAP|nr:hypothetical protein CCACVL1_07515 [Corchorus capsularis]